MHRNGDARCSCMHLPIAVANRCRRRQHQRRRVARVAAFSSNDGLLLEVLVLVRGVREVNVPYAPRRAPDGGPMRERHPTVPAQFG